MQFRHFFLLLAFFALWNLPFLNGQPVITTNAKGEAIIVFPDGTTQLFSEFEDKPEATSATDNKYPVLDVKIEPLEGAIPITEQDLRKIAERKVQLAKDAAKIAQERQEQAKQQCAYLEKEYSKAQNNPPLQQEIGARLQAAKQTEQETNREATFALNEVQKSQEIVSKGNYLEDYVQKQALKKNQAKQFEGVELTALTSYNSLVLDDNYLPFTQTDDILLTPPAPDCSYAYEGKDNRGRYRRDLREQILFTHTDERLRPFLEGKDYLRCDGFFTILGGYRYLSLEFTFAYPNAREAYGFIEKGSYLMVKLLNNQFITLRSGKMDQGTYDTESGLLTYRVHYPIDQGQINVLKRSEVNSVIVSWSSGYEEYEVYNMGFFIQQITCLE
ncbi:MAG TPA: hypothetical protein PKA00_04375 [Saprospiraceae bacterium]|nr:hypothetical protein [Saprospiraceae bacterium]HMQ82115.1 hypothetical protein [Saprospiraceae bacterium]